ncbi:hypothetical protein KKE34_03740 [Patescibacteria group bacterium]|nr:hypothetical protein [Patescibacteria group bacterium]MBU1885691.1 hypothetical protein [Patescibacteria group bacterium]
MIKTGSPFIHTSKPVRRASIILTSIISSWLLLFSGSTVYGYQTKELQKITTDPIKIILEEWQDQTKQTIKNKTENKTQEEKAAEYVRQKQLEIESRSKQELTTQIKQIQTNPSNKTQTNYYGDATSKTNENATLENFRARSQAETEKFKQESDARMEAFKTQSENNMNAFDEQAKTGMEAFKAESTAKTEAFKAEYGIE